jgi:hypothetical protein
MGAVGNAGIVSACAGCGAQTTDPSQWVRRHDSLLCSECDAALAGRSDEIGLRLTRAEQSWDKLWRRIEEALGRSA